MAPIFRIAPAPSELLKTALTHIGPKRIHHHPEYDDIIDMPGEGDPEGDPGGAGPPQSGIFIVLMVFGFVAVMFTIVAGWIWCAAANEPSYHSKRGGRRGSWRAKRMAHLKEWCRRHQNLPRTKSDISHDIHHRLILDSLSTASWHDHLSTRCESDYSYKQWRRPKDTNSWREHGYFGSSSQVNPHSPLLFADDRTQGYNTFSKEAGPEGTHILSLSLPTPPNMRELFTGVPYSGLTMPIPPLRRPPLKCVKGRTASTPSRLAHVDGDLRPYRPRSNSWSGCSGPRGRPWKYARRGPGDFGNSGGRPSWGSGGRGGSRGANRGGKLGVGLRVRGLEVVEEEALSGSEK